MRCPVGLGDVDLFGAGAQEHWYEAYEILHREAPVMRIAGGGLSPGTDAFVLTKHADVTRVVRDPDRFPALTQKRLGQLAAQGLDPEAAYAANHSLMQASMLSLRPTQELYNRHRKELTDPWVGTGASRHREMITGHVDDLIDSWAAEAAAGADIEFVRRFARPLPQRVMASILGFPQSDVPLLADWGTAAVIPFVHGHGLRHEITPEQTEEMIAGLDGFQEYIYDHVTEKRRNPRDDMISFLCGVRYEALGRPLTDLEIAGIVHAMILGGLETTQYALEEQAQLLCEHPGMFERLRADRSLLRGFVEESMRMRSPTHGLSTRITRDDEVFQGVDVPAGSLLHLRFGAANVDPDEFECPFDLDVERPAVTRHVTFSAGPRVCPGATLSRLEQQVAWGVLLDRFESIEYGDGNDWLHQPGIMLGTLHLELRLRPAAIAISGHSGARRARE
jgi:cytochrome P450